MMKHIQLFEFEEEGFGLVLAVQMVTRFILH
jgi:hypothetical protein